MCCRTTSTATGLAGLRRRLLSHRRSVAFSWNRWTLLKRFFFALSTHTIVSAFFWVNLPCRQSSSPVAISHVSQSIRFSPKQDPTLLVSSTSTFRRGFYAALDVAVFQPSGRCSTSIGRCAICSGLKEAEKVSTSDSSSLPRASATFPIRQVRKRQHFSAFFPYSVSCRSVTPSATRPRWGGGGALCLLHSRAVVPE